MKIDVHSHYYPKEYLKEIDKLNIWPSEEFKAVQLGSGEKITDENVVMSLMDEAGIDIQVLSLTSPGVVTVKADVGASLSKIVNDDFARLVEKYPDRFRAFAAIPLQDTERALKELDRAIEVLGLHGAVVPSNIAGKSIDSPELWPFYERVMHLDIPIYIHPTIPAIKGMEGYGLDVIVGWLFDSTLAILRLILSGVLEKFPELKVILAHLGSTVPYIIERIDMLSKKTSQQFGALSNIREIPSKYFKRIYVDTVSFYKPALMCGYATQGPDKLLLGSDYPWGDLKRTVTIIEELNIPEEDKQKIFYQNAAKLLRIKQ